MAATFTNLKGSIQYGGQRGALEGDEIERDK